MQNQMHGGGDYRGPVNEVDSQQGVMPLGRKQDISDVLQQIMTITDQSLDEAQARLAFFLVHAYIDETQELRVTANDTVTNGCFRAVFLFDWLAG